MPLTRTILTDHTGALGTAAAALAGLPPVAVYGYLTTRLLILVILIAIAARRATQVQRIDLALGYLTGTTPTRDPRSGG
jgi:hypothetical protein